MKVLLDAHVLLWWMAEDKRLSPKARGLIADTGTTLLWSVASTWELAIKAALGKLRLPEPVGDYLASRLRRQDIDVLPITQPHAALVETLPPHHRDPFDRMLVAQAKVEGLAIVTSDRRLAAYGVSIHW